MKITRQELFSKGKKLFEEEVIFTSEEVKDVPSIISLEPLKAKVSVENITDVTIVKISLKGKLVLRSTRSLKPVDFFLKANDEIIYTLNKELVDDDTVYYFNEDELDLRPFYYSLLVTSIPIKIIGKDDEFVSGDDWEVISEEEYYRRKQNDVESSPFSALLDLDLDE